MKDDRLYLNHILECSNRVKECVQGGRDKFLADHIIQDAVLRNLQIMTESTQRLSQELKDRNPEVDWRGLSGFRNILVHEYLGVDLEIVWELVEQKLLSLIRMAESELKRLA
jgi:uncharacterized protein with HEPN domain